VSEIVPRDVYREHVEAGNNWADKHGAAELLEVVARGVRAQQYITKRQAGLTNGEAEEHARASKEYQDAEREAVEARQEANRARVRYDSCKALFEAQRTAEASHRAAARAAT